MLDASTPPTIDDEDPLPSAKAAITFSPAWTGLLKSDLSDRAVRVYLMLHSYVRPGWTTFPKISTVAEDFQASESYVKRGLTELRRAGVVVILKKDFAGGMRRVNEYEFPPIYDDTPPSVTSGPPLKVKSDPHPSVTPDPPIEVEEVEVEEVEEERSGSVDPEPSDALPVSGSRMKDPDTGEPATDEKRLEVFSALAGELARLVSANAEREIRPTAAWVREIRLLVEKDGRDPREVWRVLTWSQQDEFWKGNILSAGKLRAQYDRLRIQWKSGRGRTATDRNLDLVARLEAEEAAGAPERSLMDVLDGMVSDGRKELGR